MISVFGNNLGDKEIEYVTKCLKSRWLGMGKVVEEFEEKFAEHHNLENFLMIDNCSNGLYMAMKVLGLPPGSKVIVPSFTWVSCAQAVLLAGYQPVFADVNIRTMNIDKASILECLRKHRDAAAIMVVHYAGLPCEMDEILSFGLPVVEDAAHAVNSKYKGKYCGDIGDIGVFSFDAIKNLCAGDAGGICFKSKEHYERAKTLRYCGIGKGGFEAAMTENKRQRWWEYNIKEPFIRMLPTNLTASIALAQLERLDELQEIRQELWQEYQSEFYTVPWITTPADGYSHSYFTYCIRIPRRDSFAKELLDLGVYTTLRYHPLHLNPLYKQTAEVLPNCELLNEDALNIPLHPWLATTEVLMIMDVIKKIGESHGLR